MISKFGYSCAKKLSRLRLSCGSIPHSGFKSVTLGQHMESTDSLRRMRHRKRTIEMSVRIRKTVQLISPTSATDKNTRSSIQATYENCRMMPYKSTASSGLERPCADHVCG